MCETCGVTVHTKPAWVERCIRRYRRQGLSEREAARRCYGAYHNQGKGSSELNAVAFVKSGGMEYMRIVTSNSYRDREGEYITTEALRNYVESQWDGDTFRGNNYLLYFHSGIPIGYIVWADMVGPFLVEVAAKRLSGVPAFQKVIDRIWERVRQNPGYYGASHGFRAGPGDMHKDTFTRIEKFETSVLPRCFAANVLTSSEVINDGQED